MTIPDGVEKFGLKVKDVIAILKVHGFEVIGGA
jgi:hypothetical protein